MALQCFALLIRGDGNVAGNLAVVEKLMLVVRQFVKCKSEPQLSNVILNSEPSIAITNLPLNPSQ